ncbi:MAG: 4a-hydroxytetrahydrobiopterin dehydratase [Gammaproteobacteria bacterium]
MANSSELLNKKCEPCEGGVPPLEKEAAVQLLQALHDDWSMTNDGKWIRREFEFTGYGRTMGFVNAVAWVANTEGHHPDLEVGYYKCVVNYTTHAIDGLSENDFICAAKIDRLITG